MKKISRYCAAVLAVVMALSGCGANDSRISDDSQPESSSASDSSSNADPSNVNIGVAGAAVSVADIKEAYGIDDSKEIMPLYNVSQTEAFEFNFNFDAFETDVELYDFVSVHTDLSCSEESKIFYTASLDVAEGKTKLTVAPMKPVLATEEQSKQYAYEQINCWGNAPIYYIALHYDLEADSPAKLETPVVIPFTVNKEVKAPTVKGVVSEDGRFSLQWDPVEGAEKYIIYNLVDDALSTGSDNHPLNGAQSGYDCGMNATPENQLYLLYDDETTDCFFDGFAGKEGHSIAEVENMLTGKLSNSGQNYSVCGEYFVTAVVNGKESGLSNPVTTADLVLPHKMTEESEIKGRYDSPADFPAQVEVINIDGTTSLRNVSYVRTHVDCYEYQWDEYDYKVEGTYLYGSVCFDNDIGEPQSNTGSEPETGNTPPEDDVEKTPSPDVETIIPVEDGQPDEQPPEDEPLIDTQADNTQEHIESGNQETVEGLPEGVYVNSDSAEEEWLARNLVLANEQISVEAFPALQNPYTLSDLLMKVYYQNPYIMNIASFAYDYNTMTLSVSYVLDKETIRANQEDVSGKASEVVSANITENMTDEEKINTLYNYLVNNSVYDTEACEKAQESGFSTVPNGYANAFNTHGILVEGKGVCMSYAYSFKLLCDLSGVDCTVVTGYLNGNLPHAWNIVTIGGNKYEIDCTNNEVNTGIPYFLYEADSSLAQAAGYTKDKMFAIDAEADSFNGSDGSMEYYNKNGLCPETIDQYKQLMTANITADTEIFIVRWQGEIDTRELNNAIILAFNELGLEDKLETLRYSAAGGFIIIITGEQQ